MTADSPETPDPTRDTTQGAKAPKKKMSRAKKIWLSISGGVAVLLAVVLVYGFVITSSGYWLISKFTPDSEEVKQSFTSAAATTQTIADEGFVLMQNDDNFLPLKTSADAKTGINLFGMRAVQLVYNSGGSSASNVDRAIRLEDALQGENGNYNVNPDLLNLYYNYYKSGDISIDKTDAPANSSASEFIEEPSNITVPEVPANAYTDTTLYSDGKTILDHAKDFSDTAMIVLGRGGGEMYDFTVKELQLQDDEAAMVDDVANKFSNVILVINSANAMELDFVDKYPSIKSVVWIGYPGESGINSLARIINGTVNPSGHLADTWLKDNMANPAANNYLEAAADGAWDKNSFHYTNLPENDAVKAARSAAQSVGGDEVGFFTQESEGIYVGYKYYETRHDTDSSYKYDDVVMYPFGRGLSYTTFEKSILGMEEKDGEITLRVGVKNTGDVAGKDVIEVYSNPAYTGKIEKATVNLVTFKKTNEIAPGATENYSITFPVEDLASYDYKTNKAYVLEAGDYQIQVRDDSHTLIDSATYTVDTEKVYAEGKDGKRDSDQSVATNQFDDALGVDDYLTRDWKSDARAFTGPQKSDFTAPQEVIDAFNTFKAPSDASLGLTEADMPKTGVTLDKTIMLADMVGVPADDPKWDEFVSQLTVQEMADLGGNGAWIISAIDRLGVPKTMTPDGSTTIGSSTYSGAIMGKDGHGVTYPIPGVIAASWNSDIAYMMGTSVASEAQAIGFAGWYAPAMNIHRTPFNGRNFEYYSEDGTLAGKTAGQVIKAATDNGIITYMKHFAMNERETGVRSYLFTWSNEQAIREIYLKPFELAVKDGGSLAAMSAFDFIGPTWAGGNSALLTDVLRDEWGFNGLVITDANMYPFMDVVEASYAGGDMSLDVMSAWKPGEGGHASLLAAAAAAPESKIGMTRNLTESAKSILFSVSRSWPVANK